jgi:hypothetical protein
MEVLEYELRIIDKGVARMVLCLRRRRSIRLGKGHEKALTVDVPEKVEGRLSGDEIAHSAGERLHLLAGRFRHFKTLRV